MTRMSDLDTVRAIIRAAEADETIREHQAILERHERYLGALEEITDLVTAGLSETYPTWRDRIWDERRRETLVQIADILLRYGVGSTGTAT